MGKKQIIAIVSLMSLALIGIIIIQLYWIRESVAREEQAFGSSINLVLKRVQKNIEDKFGSNNDAYEFFKNNSRTDVINPIDRSTSDLSAFQKQKLQWELKSLQTTINPSMLLESINPKELDDLIKQEMVDQQLGARYEYGIFSNELEDFIIINGVYAAVIGETEDMSSSGATSNESLYDAEYQIQLFASEFDVPGYLKLAILNKQGWIWSSVLPSLISSILFTGLILFCFSYTIYVILRQKKVGEMKTDFINNMTHEFKTPIATISLAADSINNPKILNNPEKVQRFSKIIKEENRRMLSQVEKVLQMALLDKKDFTLNISDINLNELVKSAVQNGNLQVQAKGGSVKAELTAKNAKIEGDETHISNIIYNLLDNAIKYTPEQPEIIISTKEKPNGIEFAVTDNGIGMTKDARKQIFDKFYRVHTGNLHDVKGFGLGLSYVKAIVTAHKGRIDVQSELGKGSKFTVFLPHKQM